jgi:hypothetical protein
VPLAIQTIIHPMEMSHQVVISLTNHEITNVLVANVSTNLDEYKYNHFPITLVYGTPISVQYTLTKLCGIVATVMVSHEV